MRARQIAVVSILPALLSAYACGGSLTDIPDADQVDAASDSTTDSADAGSDSTSNPCGANEVYCSGTCFPNDANHCGPSCASCGSPNDGVATCDGTKCGFKCNSLQCGNTCVDATTDTHNCGSCGHDCLGTSCSGGACTPENIYPVSAGSAIIGLVVDNTSLYWLAASSNASIFRAPKGGGGTPVAIALSVPVAFNITLVNGNVVWTQPGSSSSISVYSPDAGTTSYVPTPVSYLSSTISGDSQSLFFGSGYGQAQPVYKTPYDGGAPTPLAQASGNVLVLQASGSELFYAVDQNQYESLWRVDLNDLDAGATQIYTPDAATYTVRSLAVDEAGTHVYMASDGQPLLDVPPDGGPAKTLSATNGPIAIDSMNVYFGNGGVFRIPIGGTAATQVAPSVQGSAVAAVAVDDEYVYWALVGSTSTGIYRVAK